MTTLPLQAPHVRYRRYPRRRIDRLAGCARATLRLWRRRLVERRELARFDERALRDIGLGRAELLVMINKPFWKE
ncbi:MAG: DUF1127 domain-containing protein [Stellaceae bacterium]